jgi:hypothetical protein
VVAAQLGEGAVVELGDVPLTDELVFAILAEEWSAGAGGRG